MSIVSIIEEKLTKAYAPSHLRVINESHKHKGHAGDDGSGESHFLLEIASDFFNDLNRVDAQRHIYKTIDHEMKTQIHALSIKIKK